jgi:hypothetical protein
MQMHGAGDPLVQFVKIRGAGLTAYRGKRTGDRDAHQPVASAGALHRRRLIQNYGGLRCSTAFVKIGRTSFRL